MILLIIITYCYDQPWKFAEIYPVAKMATKKTQFSRQPEKLVTKMNDQQKLYFSLILEIFSSHMSI